MRDPADDITAEDFDPGSYRSAARALRKQRNEEAAAHRLRLREAAIAEQRNSRSGRIAATLEAAFEKHSIRERRALVAVLTEVLDELLPKELP